MWWYIAMFLGSFTMAMATIYSAKSGLPWWGLIVAILISSIFLPFVITVYAITGVFFLTARFPIEPPVLTPIFSKASRPTFSHSCRCSERA